MKRRISFLISVGSHFPKHIPGFSNIPIGGESKTMEFEFETTGGSHSFDDACKELKMRMGDENYHIWYWDWLDL